MADVASEIKYLVNFMDDLEHRSFATPPTPSAPAFCGIELAFNPNRRVVITEKGLFYGETHNIAPILARLPGSHMYEVLFERWKDGAHLPLEEIAEPVFEGDKLRLRWRRAELEIQLASGEGTRVSQFLAGLKSPAQRGSVEGVNRGEPAR